MKRTDVFATAALLIAVSLSALNSASAQTQPAPAGPSVRDILNRAQSEAERRSVEDLIGKLRSAPAPAGVQPAPTTRGLSVVKPTPPESAVTPAAATPPSAATPTPTPTPAPTESATAPVPVPAAPSAATAGTTLAVTPAAPTVTPAPSVAGTAPLGGAAGAAATATAAPSAPATPAAGTPASAATAPVVVTTPSAPPPQPATETATAPPPATPAGSASPAQPAATPVSAPPPPTPAVAATDNAPTAPVGQPIGPAAVFPKPVGTSDSVMSKAPEIAAQKGLPTVDVEVLFSYDSAGITPDTAQSLMTLGRALSDPRLADGKFVIAGHTDAKGRRSYNQGLSQRRAEAVRSFLIREFKLSPDALIARGFGETRLKNPSSPLAAENRRVQVINWTSEIISERR